MNVMIRPEENDRHGNIRQNRSFHHQKKDVYFIPFSSKGFCMPNQN